MQGWTGDLCDEVEVIKYTAEVRVGRCTPTSQFRLFLDISLLFSMTQDFDFIEKVKKYTNL